MFIIIRPETPADYLAITEVNDLAFGQPGEGKLIEDLRKNPEFAPELSLVAEIDGKIVGHILFFPVIIRSAAGKQKAAISLAPVSIRPEFQRQGIGSKLVIEGLKACRQSGHDSVVVLGHHEYYPKFGFKQASTWGIKDPFGAPAEAFMALELNENALEDIKGVVEYPEEFNNV